MNFIIELFKESKRRGFCTNPTCGTCGSYEIIDFLIKKFKDRSIDTQLVETPRDYHRTLNPDHRSISEKKFEKTLAKEICKELNLIDDNHFNHNYNDPKSELILRNIIYKVWLMVDCDTNKLKNLLSNGVAGNYLKKMEAHSEALRIRYLETAKKNALNKELNAIKKLKKQERHEKRVADQKRRKSQSYLHIKNYFKDNRDNFLDDLISNNLSFPLDLTPIEEITSLITKIKKLDVDMVGKLLNRISKSSSQPKHIEHLQRELCDQYILLKNSPRFKLKTSLMRLFRLN